MQASKHTGGKAVAFPERQAGEEAGAMGQQVAGQQEEAAYLSVEGAQVGYGETVVVRDVDLSVCRGQILTLVGPNGSGKSTILKSIIGQLKLAGGAVYLDGREMGAMSARDVARRLSILMTERMQPELMTCWDVVATGRYPYTGRMGVLTDEDKAIVDESLALVSAGDLAQRDFTAISDGQRQRVLLARALCQQPEVIVLDEPTSFLDIRHKLELLSILKGMVCSRQLAVIMSLHEIDLAQRVSDVVACVHNGRIERIGSPEEVFTERNISHLYGLGPGVYNEAFSSVELPRVTGSPRVFVIGGAGSGISAYRVLQRLQIPFAAGVLASNDVDFPVAKALATQVVGVGAFCPVEEDACRQARSIIDGVECVIMCVDARTPANEGNHLLFEAAAASGKRIVDCRGERGCAGLAEALREMVDM